MGFNHGGLLVGECLFLCLAELFDETHRLALQAALEASAGTGVDELNELNKSWSASHCTQREKEKDIHILIAQVEELLELDAAVGEGTERALLLHLCRLGGVGDEVVRLQETTTISL